MQLQPLDEFELERQSELKASCRVRKIRTGEGREDYKKVPNLISRRKLETIDLTDHPFIKVFTGLRIVSGPSKDMTDIQEFQAKENKRLARVRRGLKADGQWIKNRVQVESTKKSKGTTAVAIALQKAS